MPAVSLSISIFDSIKQFALLKRRSIDDRVESRRFKFSSINSMFRKRKLMNMIQNFLSSELHKSKTYDCPTKQPKRGRSLKSYKAWMKNRKSSPNNSNRTAWTSRYVAKRYLARVWCKRSGLKKRETILRGRLLRWKKSLRLYLSFKKCLLLTSFEHRV